MMIDSNTFDSELNFILHKMIAVNPTERYEDLDSLEVDLAEYIDKRLHKSDKISDKKKLRRLIMLLKRVKTGTGADGNLN